MIYLVTKPSGKQGYNSFRRLLKEENIEAMCKKTGEEIPKRNDLPRKIAYNQITIEIVEVDERL